MVDGLRAHIEAQPEENRILKEGRLKLEMHRMRVALRDGDGERMKPQREWFEAREYAWSMAEGSWFLLSCLRALDLDG